MDFDINKIICSALSEIIKEGIPIFEGWYDEELKKTHITFFVYSEYPSNFSDDTETSYIHNIQLDIWTIDGVQGNKLKNRIRNLLKKNRFSFDESNDQFENDTKIYHKAMRFTYIEDLY